MHTADWVPPTTLACPRCATGTQRLRRVALAQWFGGQFIVISNFPAWVCDVCGERDYDPAALDQVQLVLGPATEARPQPAARARSGPATSEFDPRPLGRRRMT